MEISRERYPQTSLGPDFNPLSPTWWKEKTDFSKLSSDLHR